MQHLQATTQPNKRERSNMGIVVMGEQERVRMKASNSDGYCFFVLFQRVEWHHNKSRINEAYTHTHSTYTMNNSDFACME